MYFQLKRLIYDSFLFLLWGPAEALLNRNPQDFDLVGGWWWLVGGWVIAAGRFPAQIGRDHVAFVVKGLPPGSSLGRKLCKRESPEFCTSECEFSP